MRSLNPPFGHARLHRAGVPHAQDRLTERDTERDIERDMERDMERDSVTQGRITIGVCGGLPKSWECHQSTQLVELRRSPKFQTRNHSPTTPTI